MGRYRREQLLAGIDRVLSGESGTPGASPDSASPPMPEDLVVSVPESVERIRQTILPQLYAHATVDRIPAGTRLAVLKKAVAAIVRPIASRQAAFNHETLRTLELLVEEVVSNAYLHALKDAALADRDRTIARQQAELRRLGESSARHDTTLDQHDATLARQWKAIEEHWAAIGHHSRQLEEHAATFPRQWVEIERLSGVLDEHAAALEANGGVLAELRASTAQHTDTLARQWKAIEEHWAAIGHHSRQLEEHAATFPRQWDAIARAESALRGQLTPEVQRLQDRIAALEGRQHDAEARIAFAIEFRSRVLELLESGAVSRESGAGSRAPESPGTPPSALRPSPSALLLDDLVYLQFQQRFRGDEATLRADQHAYVGRVAPHLELPAGEQCRALDVACGEGLLVDLLSKHGWDAHGVDINKAFADKARASGLAVVHGDAFDFLRAADARSWHLVSALQFVEHLDAAQLTDFVREAHRVLKPGGLLLVETLNPNTLLAHKWFQLDLTHRHLVFPQFLELLCETAGLVPIETRFIHEPPPHERLESPAEDGPVRRNADRLNALLFGPQDYYLIARKPL